MHFCYWCACCWQTKKWRLKDLQNFTLDQLETEKGLCCKTKLGVLFSQAQGKDDKEATFSKTTFSSLPDREASSLQNRWIFINWYRNEHPRILKPFQRSFFVCSEKRGLPGLLQEIQCWRSICCWNECSNRNIDCTYHQGHRLFGLAIVEKIYLLNFAFFLVLLSTVASTSETLLMAGNTNSLAHLKLKVCN